MGAHALLANGGVMAPAGAHMIALAAKHHSVPFVVLAGLHKLSPLFPDDPSVSFNDLKVPTATGSNAHPYLCGFVKLFNPSLPSFTPRNWCKIRGLWMSLQSEDDMLHNCDLLFKAPHVTPQFVCGRAKHCTLRCLTSRALFAPQPLN